MKSETSQRFILSLQKVRRANLGSHRAALLLDCLRLGGELLLQPLAVALKHLHLLLYFNLPQQTKICLSLHMTSVMWMYRSVRIDRGVRYDKLVPSLAGCDSERPSPRVQLHPAWRLHLTRTQSCPAGKRRRVITKVVLGSSVADRVGSLMAACAPSSAHSPATGGVSCAGRLSLRRVAAAACSGCACLLSRPQPATNSFLGCSGSDKSLPYFSTGSTAQDVPQHPSSAAGNPSRRDPPAIWCSPPCRLSGPATDCTVTTRH